MAKTSRLTQLPLSERIALSPEDANALSGIGVTRIREAAASGALEAHKHGRRVIILRESLLAWIKSMPRAAHTRVPCEVEVEAENKCGNRLQSEEAVGRNRPFDDFPSTTSRKARMQIRAQKVVKKR